jgi:gamma-glutamyl-gamma-aminobutyraldehyde dehydrogenase/4-guanidinobutyraldehyde dehydrogenase/NAD-dependent aldehyde dehydrogenase
MNNPGLPDGFDTLMKRLSERAYIDGEYVRPKHGRTIDAVNPANGRTLVPLAACDESDVDRAVAAARAAVSDRRWRGRAPRDRKRILLRLADLIDDHAEELALLDCLEMGKPIRDSRQLDVPKSSNMLRWYAEAIDKLYGEVAPTDQTALATITREPLGVIGAVVPWNFPLYVAMYKLAPALATGNSVVLKPAEQSSLSVLHLAALADEAGVPPGVLNVIPGQGEVAGQAIGRHMDVDAVCFTGSSAVGKQFLRYAADSNMKRVQIEGGGKSAHIVMADGGDLDVIAEQAAWGIFWNQGQVCSAGSRLLVDGRIHDDLVSRIAAFASSLTVGDPLDPRTDLGAIVDDRQLDRVLGYIESGRVEGAELALGGRRVREESGGYFVEPTIFTGVDHGMRIAQEEIFGPVLSVMRFRDEDEALRIANGTIYGLGAAVWSRDLSTALRVASQLEAGQVWVNNYDQADLTVPWGGVKQSGLGRDKSLHALDEYTSLKATWIHIDVSTKS